MAFMGNMTTATANEINPNNFAARPGMIANNAPKPENDYLFGANIGHTHLENNLNISKSVIKTRLPVSLPRIGQTVTPEEAKLYGALIIGTGIAISSYLYVNKNDESAKMILAGSALAWLFSNFVAKEGGVA